MKFIHLAVVPFLAICSCEPSSPVQKSSTKPQSPTSEQAATLAWAIQGKLKLGDYSAFDNSCDLNAFVKRLIGSTPLTEGMRACVARVVEGEPELTGLNELTAWTRSLGGWRFLFVRPHQGGPRPVFRAIDSVGFPVYFELHLEPAEKTLPRIVDLTLSSIGEPVSEFMRRTYMPPPESWDRLSQLKAPVFADLLEAARTIAVPLLTEFYAPERWPEFAKYFERHREALRSDKSVHLARLRLAAVASPGDFSDAFEDYEKCFPGDPSLKFWRIAALRLKGRWDDALLAVDVIDQDFRDSYLDVIRSRIHVEAGRLAKAEAFAKKCTDAEPSLPEGWYARVTLSLQQKDTEATGLLLAAADKASTIELKRLQTLGGFDEFEATEEFKAWRAGRSK